jgi:hypothetical protein
VKTIRERSEKPNGSNDEEQKAGGEKLFDLAEKVVKLSAILGVFGYMSLRSHLNYLGISSTSSLGLERYLMETYNFVLTTFFPLLSMLLRIAIGFLFLCMITMLIIKALRINEAARKLKNRLYKYWSAPFGSGLVLLIVLSFYVWMQTMINSYWVNDSIAVGQLQPSRLQVSDGELFYYLSCAVCLFGCFIYSQMSKALKSRSHKAGHLLSRAFMISSAILILAVALHLPTLYGRLIHPTDYTLVEVNIKDRENQPICGLLVLNSATAISIWQAEKGIGRVIEIPQSEIATLITGPTSDLLSMARESALDNTLVRPNCDLQSGAQAVPAKH